MSDSKLRSILLVEDNANDVELTMIALERAGLPNPVHVVPDGEEAIAFLRHQNQWARSKPAQPAVILLDKKLPKVDGHEVLATIKSDLALKHIPVVMLTSSREETDLLKSYELGVNAYVVKPVEFEDFMEAIRDIGAFWVVLNAKPEIKNS
ncbi:response regulator [Caballeronia novacaledonica]|uniref:Response regulator n=1 Tax=Caballeronia novacaledonica TaxID=1544861 RepID=A0AA37IJA7_9BURK|nr:response regulator [Caballeronia novacaledonica]GJH30383.1 response regulator [Caballeronia novacaledonica]